MLNYIKYNFEDIESYIQQLDEKNQTYIRITRQKLTYMLSMDTSIKGDIVALLQNAKERPVDYWRKMSQCFNLFDVRQVMEGSFYHPRKKHVRNDGEELGIEEPTEVSQEEIDAVVNTRASRFTNIKINEYVQYMLRDRDTAAARDMALEKDDDYLVAIFLAMDSTDYRSRYLFESDDNMVIKGRYKIPNFTLKRKDGYRK
jgi:hypothetical protein